MRHIFLAANESKTVHLPVSVRMTSSNSSFLLSVRSLRPITALASVCTSIGCDHSLLHDVSSWGTHYYPVTPHFPNESVVSQMVITSSDHNTSVDIFLSGDMLFKGNVYLRGSFLKMHIGVLQSVYLQSNSSLSGSEVTSLEAVGVMVGFTCSKHTTGHCLYGFAQLKPASDWGFDYIIPPLANTRMSSSFLLAMTAIQSEVDITTSTGRRNVSLLGGIMKVIPLETSDKIHITSDSPLQLVYFGHDNAPGPSALTVLLSVDDICQTLPMLYSVDMSEQQDDSSQTVSGVEFSQNFTQLPDDAEPSSPYTDTDVGYYLSTMNRQTNPAVCEKGMYCGFLNDILTVTFV